MSMFRKLAFGVAILAFGAAPTFAQDKLVPEEGAIEVMLLRQDSVRKELKLAPDVAEKIHKHTDMQWKKAKDVAKLSKDERDKKFAQMTKENDAFIDATVTKEQRMRLQQIELQVVGLLCITRPAIAKQLKLTDEQMKTAAHMQKEARQEMEEFLETSKSEKRQEKLAELRKTSRDRLLDLLTAEQEKTWAHLTGTPFKGEFVFGKTVSKATSN